MLSVAETKMNWSDKSTGFNNAKGVKRGETGLEEKGGGKVDGSGGGPASVVSYSFENIKPVTHNMIYILICLQWLK